MSTPNQRPMLVVLITGVLLLAAGVRAAGAVRSDGGVSSSAAAVEAETVFYGVEVNGVVCGYARFDISPMEREGRELILLKEYLLSKLTVLGMAFDSKVELTYHVDPASGQFVYHDSKLEQGDINLSSTVTVDGDTIRSTSNLGAGEDRVAVGPDVVLENTLFFPHLVRDFVDGGASEKTYDIYEVRDGEVQRTKYTKVGTEELEFAGTQYDALVLDEINLKTGLKIKWWIDTGTGRFLKVRPLTGREIFLATPSIVKRIETANMDELIMSTANVRIADIAAITYLKVRAVIEPVGLIVTPEGLNVPGQRFEGTVKDNLIEGIFEIEHPRYDGAGAPPFPPDFTGDESLAAYLEATEFIESGDPVLSDKARELTAGAKDSWEAATRLSAWVAEKITYAIPGGGTSRKTYDIRAGECGAHSLLLAAFCRAVGIPARVVWGCMYTPSAGGSFGQHGWNEIYMGDAGWIPVDATAGETDFVDSGHIRMGEMESITISFNPHEMEILDHRIGTGEAADAAALAAYEPYVGSYVNVADTAAGGLNIVVQGDALALDVPNRVVLALNDPDEKGRWYCAMAPRLFLTFAESDGGGIDTMEVHELVIMTRKADPDTIDESVPDELEPYLGIYYFAARSADFTVNYLDGALALYDPFEKVNVGLGPPDDEGWRWDEYRKNRIRFDRDGGKVTGLTIDAISTLRRRPAEESQ